MIPRSRLPVLNPGRALLVVALLTVGLVACGEDQAEPTVEQQLEQIKGRDLRPSEIEDLETVADTTCTLESPLLEAIWEKLEVSEFEFQDFIISQRCPQRAVEYALATGRVVTEEAKVQTEGITLPSSTLPTTTTPTTNPSTERSTTTESGPGSTTSTSTSSTATTGSTTTTDPTTTEKPGSTTTEPPNSTTNSTTTTTSTTTTRSTTTTTTTTTTESSTTESTTSSTSAPPSTGESTTTEPST